MMDGRSDQLSSEQFGEIDLSIVALCGLLLLAVLFDDLARPLRITLVDGVHTFLGLCFHLLAIHALHLLGRDLRWLRCLLCLATLFELLLGVQLFLFHGLEHVVKECLFLLYGLLLESSQTLSHSLNHLTLCIRLTECECTTEIRAGIIEALQGHMGLAATEQGLLKIDGFCSRFDSFSRKFNHLRVLIGGQIRQRNVVVQLNEENMLFIGELTHRRLVKFSDAQRILGDCCIVALL
mmetsp:Transcript_15277/g.38889  ORF Transcript_15277/g.38889 Transcript_15277/m.38889 type:complete len:237 (+) Transcript_15277:932-1642(+)